jgi:hypothetical protein
MKKFSHSKREIRNVNGMKRTIEMITNVRYCHVSDFIKKESMAQVIMNHPAIKA